MSVIVHIPTILRSLTQDQRRVEAIGRNVLDIIDHLDGKHPGLKTRLVAEGQPLRFVNLYVNDADIRFLDGLATLVQPGDTLTILPAVAGGSGELPR
jgi:sulfur-carrier protein